MGDYKPLHDQGGLAAVARALRAQPQAAPPQPAPPPAEGPPPRKPTRRRAPAAADADAAAPAAVRAYAAFRAAEEAAAEAAAAAPQRWEAPSAAPAARSFRDLYAEEFMSSFADELEATQRGAGAGAGTDLRLLADSIKAGADAFSAEERVLHS